MPWNRSFCLHRHCLCLETFLPWLCFSLDYNLGLAWYDIASFSSISPTWKLLYCDCIILMVKWKPIYRGFGAQRFYLEKSKFFSIRQNRIASFSGWFYRLNNGHANCEVIFTPPLEFSSRVLSTGVCKIIETLKNLAIMAQIYTQNLCARRMQSNTYYIMGDRTFVVLSSSR